MKVILLQQVFSNKLPSKHLSSQDIIRIAYQLLSIRIRELGCSEGIAMAFDTKTLIWLFPIAFILHDFEELMLFEPWLKKNAGLITNRIKNKVPAFVEKQLQTVLGKSTTQFAFPIFLIFCLTCISSLLAAELESYPLFLIASSMFFLHGFMHIGQAILIRRYVPALITSLLIALPYGMILFRRLLEDGIVNKFGLSFYFLIVIILAVPFILGMHVVGEFVYERVIKSLFG